MDEDDTILILREDGTPVGFVWLRWISSAAAEFEPLGVVQTCQNRGLGRFLLQRAIEAAANRGAKEISVSVWKNNNPAVHLYRSLGFVHRQTKTYLGLDLRLR